MPDWEIVRLETPVSLQEIEELQDVIWPGSHREIVPVHMFLAAIYNWGSGVGGFLKKPDDRNAIWFSRYVFRKWRNEVEALLPHAGGSSGLAWFRFRFCA